MALATRAWGHAMALAMGHSQARKWDLVMERDGQRILEQEQAEVKDVEGVKGRKTRPGRK
jgi:hypothetical protein